MQTRRFLVSLSLIFASLGVASSVSGQSDVRADYIVTFTSEKSMGPALEAVKAAGGRVFHTYRHALVGVAVSLPVAAAQRIASRPDVASIEQDQPVTISATQSNATWGLDRIDQRALPVDTTYNYNADGTYNAGASRVDAYIIDTGILSTHVEFRGRVGAGYSAISDRRGTTDCNGHGTHVSGTVGGTTYGVAKGVRLIPVRVLDCRGSGSTTGVVAGIDWVASHHTSGPAVANMSLGGTLSTVIDTAVKNLVADGVVVVVAAGNENVDACSKSPARAAEAITVGATTSTDVRASYSNFGSCLDIFAPGSLITSAWFKSTTATNTISGTSMASPHVAGVAALVLSNNPSASVATVTSSVVSGATTNVVAFAGTGSPNRLVYSQLP